MTPTKIELEAEELRKIEKNNQTERERLEMIHLTEQLRAKFPTYKNVPFEMMDKKPGWFHSHTTYSIKGIKGKWEQDTFSVCVKCGAVLMTRHHVDTWRIGYLDPDKETLQSEFISKNRRPRSHE